MVDLCQFVLQLLEDFEFINDIMDDDDDIAVFSAVSCFMRRNLTRVSGHFEQTIRSNLPVSFGHLLVVAFDIFLLCFHIFPLSQILIPSYYEI